jgi:hypothetical protein
MKFELDLHNVRHADVPKSVDKFLGHHICRGSMEVRVITGNSESMKKIVKETLLDYRLDAEQSLLNSGTLIVRLF